MTGSCKNVSAAQPPGQRWQGPLLLVSGRDGAHPGGSASADAVLPRRVERLGAGAVAEDHRSLQRAGRDTAAEAVSVPYRTTCQRSWRGTGTAEQSPTGAHTRVRRLLAGTGTVEAARA